MSRHDHPAYCCKRFNRITPSGNVQSWHSFTCKVSPNQFIEPRRAEIASHAEHRPSQADLDYRDAHMDDDDDIRNGGWA